MNKKNVSGFKSNKDEFGVFISVIDMLYSSQLVVGLGENKGVFNPNTYLQLLPYKQPADYWGCTFKQQREQFLNPENPLGIPSNDFKNSPYKGNEAVEIRKVIIDHPVYYELMNPDNWDFLEEVDDYLDKYGLCYEDDHYELNQFRLLGVIANTIELHFRDCNRPLKSIREEYLVDSSVSKFHFNGQVLAKPKIESAIKKAEALKKALDPDLLMYHSGDILKLEGLLNSLITLNSKVLDENEKLEHFLFRGDKNNPNHPIRILIFRLSMFFYQVNNDVHRKLVESIVRLIEPEYDQATLGRHLDDAEQFCIEITL